MANMSYCRFQNTSRDLSNFLDAIAWNEELSDLEIRNGKDMFREFLQFCKDAYIIGEFDEECIDSLFENLREKEDEEQENAAWI